MHARKIIDVIEAKDEVAVKFADGDMRFWIGGSPTPFWRRMLPDDGPVEPEGNMGLSTMNFKREFTNRSEAQWLSGQQ